MKLRFEKRLRNTGLKVWKDEQLNDQAHPPRTKKNPRLLHGVSTSTWEPLRLTPKR